MQVASVTPNGLALVRDDAFVLIGEPLARQGLLPHPASMIDFIARYDSLNDSLEDIIAAAQKVNLDPKSLQAPVQRPSKIWAAAFNYKRGTDELSDAAGRGRSSKYSKEEILEMTFLKPSSAVIGPSRPFLSPKGERTVYPELELRRYR